MEIKKKILVQVDDIDKILYIIKYKNHNCV